MYTKLCESGFIILIFCNDIMLDMILVCICIREELYKFMYVMWIYLERYVNRY